MKIINLNFRKSFIFCLLLLLGLPNLKAQDIEKIAKAKPLQVSGGLGLNNVFYNANGINARRNLPYQYYINGNVSFTFFGELVVPLTVSYSNQQLNYNNPLNQQQFNQFGISPRYRWITLHAGWRNMTFSPYSLNGHTFLGTGAELSPGKWKIKAMYGRLLKAVEMDTTSTGKSNIATYGRYGGGLFVRYEDKGNHYDVSLFNAADRINTLKKQPDSLAINPEQNFVWGLGLGQNITSKFKFEGEFSRSSLTRDVRVPEKNSNIFLTTNGSTVNYNAYKGVLSYTLGAVTIGAGYERIDPGYKTLGAYFFNNDMRNITGNLAATLLKKRLSFQTSIGAQRNNLDQTKVSTMRRWIGSLNINFKASKKLTLGFGYSSFQTYTNIRSQFLSVNTGAVYQNIDTLNFVQISQSFNGNMSYLLAANKKRQQNINFNGSLQKASDKQGGNELATGSQFYNLNGGYNLTWLNSGLFLNLVYMANWNKSALSNSSINGPMASIGKSFFKKKMRSDIGGSWNISNDNTNNKGTVWTLRFNTTLSAGKKHSFNFSAIYLNKEQQGAVTSVSFDEFTARLGYNLRF